MKGQLMPLVFFVLVIFGVIVGYVFFNTFYGTKYERELFDVRVLSLIDNVIQAFKGYLSVSLDYSNQQALRESACLGGLISVQPWAWICYGKYNPLLPEVSIACQEVFTQYYLNVYANNFSVQLPLASTINNYTTTNIEVNPSQVYTGTYDEANFWVRSYDSSVTMTGKTEQSQENLSTSDFITRNRFWYMFRIYDDWARENYYGKCLCGATKGCGDCVDKEKCADEALKRLQQRFDEFVTCRRDKSTSCCIQDEGPPCGESTSCQVWDAMCHARCDDPCLEPPLDYSACIPSGIVFTAGFGENTPQNSVSKPGVISFSSHLDGCYSIIWNEWRLAGQDVYTCKDSKYFVPSPKGPIPLEFRGIAHGTWFVEHPNCERKVRCDCPSDVTDCSQCRRTGCTPCK